MVADKSASRKVPWAPAAMGAGGKLWSLGLALLASAAVASDRVQVPVGALVLEAPAALRGQAEALARRAERVLPRLESDLGVEPAAPYRIFLISAGPLADPDLERLNATAPPWAAGFLHAGQRVGAIRVREAGRYPHADLLSVLVHECVHMLLHDASGHHLPRWFEEGVATHAGRRWGMRDVLLYSSSLLSGRLPPLDQLDRSFRSSEGRARVAYAASFDFVSWTVRRHGDDVIRRIVAEAADRPFPEAWLAATGVPLGRAEAEWRRGSLLRYRWLPVLTGTTTLWIGITLLSLMAMSRRRARSREILERWEMEEVPPDGSPRDGSVH